MRKKVDKPPLGGSNPPLSPNWTTCDTTKHESTPCRRWGNSGIKDHKAVIECRHGAKQNEKTMELYCDRVGTYKPEYNKTNGRFAKGHTPHNKGRKMSEWASPEGIENIKKGWANLDLYRNKNGRSDVAGRCAKSIVAIDYYGKMFVFKSSRTAFEFLAGGCRENISRCCKFNHNGLEPKYKPQAKKNGKQPTVINTDHQYMGFRWYFEADIEIWKDKLNVTL